MALSKLLFLSICIITLVKYTESSIIHARKNVPAPKHKFLFAASIASASEHVCSGVILNKRWIISSALCVTQHNASTLQVRYGSHNRTHNGIVKSDIETMIVHPEFEQRTRANNLALIKVNKDIQFIPTVVHAAILARKEPAERDAVDAVGWEKIDETNQSDTPEILKCHRTILTKLDECSMNQQRDANILCTDTTIEDTFPVLDNGSALISVEKNELIGIAAWHDEQFPNVYVRIPTYLPWIRSIIAETNNFVRE